MLFWQVLILCQITGSSMDATLCWSYPWPSTRAVVLGASPSRRAKRSTSVLTLSAPRAPHNAQTILRPRAHWARLSVRTVSSLCTASLLSTRRWSRSGGIWSIWQGNTQCYVYSNSSFSLVNFENQHLAQFVSSIGTMFLVCMHHVALCRRSTLDSALYFVLASIISYLNSSFPCIVCYFSTLSVV